MPTLEELKIKLSLYQRVLDLFRQVLNLTTQKEKLELEIKAREIARKYGIDEAVFIATIRCESGFNPRATNKNKDGTIDYGIAQLNSYWYIGQDKEIKTPQEALNNPEKCLDLMARMFKARRATDWICYRSGKYISFLNK